MPSTRNSRAILSANPVESALMILLTSRVIPEIKSTDPVIYPPRVVAGMKPTSIVTLYEYFRVLQRHVELHHEYPGQAFFVIDDFQALSRSTAPESVRVCTLELATIYLALGLEADKAILYRQSDVPEIMELAWILSFVTNMDERLALPPSGGAEGGSIRLQRLAQMLLSAANVLVVRGTLMPMLPDQEFASQMVRDIAADFNKLYHKEIFPIPQPHLSEVKPLPDIEDHKANELLKSIDLFGSFGLITQTVKKLLPGMADLNFLQSQTLYKYEYREPYEAWKKKPGDVEEILRHGGIRAREEAAETLEEVRSLIGL